MKLKLNREFAVRYSLVALLFLGMGGWFAFDGFVRYPRTSAAELYRSIEKAEVPEDMPPAALEAFKRQKTASQKGLALVLTVAAAWVGLLLARAAAFRFDYDEKGFVCARGRYEWSTAATGSARASCALSFRAAAGSSSTAGIMCSAGMSSPGWRRCRRRRKVDAAAVGFC